MPKVTLIPDEVTIEVAQGENLLRAAMMADVRITASCGGDGTCGKCRVVVTQGSVDSKPSSRLTQAQVEAGYVLACTSTVTGDVTVSVPPESRPGAAPVAARGGRVLNTVLTGVEQAARVPDGHSAPPVSKLLVTVAEPDHSDNVSDLSRVTHAMRRLHDLRDVEVTAVALRELPGALRQGEWSVTAIVTQRRNGVALVTGFQPGDTTDRQFVVAVDVGTTTVDVAIVDLVSRATLAHASEYNGQVDLGEDVITRIIASTRDGGAERLQTLVLGTIGALVERLVGETGLSADDLLAYVCAGNTVMTHLLLGVSPAAIRTAPYVPAAAAFPWCEASDLGLPGSSATRVITFPSPASWLGGDIVSGVIAAGIPWSEKLTLFIDVGTNGEIVLGDQDFLVACSCSAGPAFEGGGIGHGMRAADGAVEQVRIDPETLDPMVLTIGNAKPLGICGSGLIDCVAELFLCGLIDRKGKFNAVTSPRVQRGEHGFEYVVVGADESGTGRDVVLTETDIENLMRAKAAIFAGINVLVESLDFTLDAIEEIVVAGGFGHYLDLERVMALGMFPELPAERFVFVGNSSLTGARLIAHSQEMLEKADTVAAAMTYLELSVNSGFMEMYLSSLFLPHTNLSLFSNTEQLRASRTSERLVS